MIKNVIFDWSGTLMDDVIFSYNATMKVFEKIGLEKITLEEFKKEFVLPYMDFYKKFKKNADKKIIDDIFNREIGLINKSKLFPEVREILDFLKRKKIKMVILSSYHQEGLEKEIKDNDLQNFFADVNGGVHDKVSAISEIIQRNNLRPEETVCVGDMTHDIDAGKKANLITVAVLCGYQSKDKLLQKDPDFLIDSLKELKGIIVSS